MTCPACGTENRAGRKFCSSCGMALPLTCAACGAANETGDRFCGECGSALAPDGAQPAPARAPEAERRLVSVLFADLVGFTPLSEGRDPEAVRELLSRYFETARRVMGRYGGTVEKFIGDAVMAVWGTPVAREDDAERAVRAALELVDAVSTLEPGVRVRAGVVTGEAAVTLGAEGQGMVAGDVVNTASRVQAAAEAGSVLVGERTRRASEAAIQYEDAGGRELKGKAEPVQLWRATRVVAARGGEGRAAALEPPFVGRGSELRLVKDLFHATAEERRARLVSVLGIAGIGKTRLSWEFEKYIDGIVGEVFWHRGRCLAYGEGVAYWALAEMVRMRAGIAEGEAPTAAAEKLRLTVERHVADPDERAWVEPRLAQLLGLADGGSTDRDDLYAGWRLFFERLADGAPTVLVFEDLQWADAALLDFVDQLLEWSRNHPIYVLALARPEVTERPGWGAGRRDFVSIALEPLGDDAMDELLAGLVPGLPDELRARIRERAEGVPLYAVETVRMLLDRGLLRRDGDRYTAANEIETLEVPETLHALIAARLDGLEPAERWALDDAAVLGKTFTRAGLAALSGLDEKALEPILAALVRKDLLTVQTDPRSPDRGNYGFLQALVQRIAHDTLSRHEQKARHLAAARYLEQAWGADETEIVEVVAAHYLDAYRADPEADDADAIRAAVREALIRAARRAASVAATEEAQRYFEQAAALADDPGARASLLEQAGTMAESDGRNTEAIDLFERAIELADSEGLAHASARIEAELARALWNGGQIDTGVERMTRSFEVLRAEEPDADIAMLAAQLGRFQVFVGNPAAAEAPLEFALDVAESQMLSAVLAEALNTKSLILTRRGRPEEGLALLRHSLELALEHDLTESALRAYFNLAYSGASRDRLEEANALDTEGLELARRRGKRQWEHAFVVHLRANYVSCGAWEELPTIPAGGPGMHWQDRLDAAQVTVPIALAQGRLEEARDAVATFAPIAAADVQERVGDALASACIARAEGRFDDALAAAEQTLIVHAPLGPEHPLFKRGYAEAGEAAFALGDLDRVAGLLRLVEELVPVERTPLLEAHAARFAGRLAAARAEPGAGAELARGASIYRNVGAHFDLATAMLEHGEWLVETGQPDRAAPLLDEARAIFERLRCAPWLERLDRADRGTTAATA